MDRIGIDPPICMMILTDARVVVEEMPGTIKGEYPFDKELRCFRERWRIVSMPGQNFVGCSPQVSMPYFSGVEIKPHPLSILFDIYQWHT